MTGSGNDFVMIDGRNSSPEEWAVADIQAVCARGTGIGADGVVFVGAGATPEAVRVIYFNSDGTRATCGNAALCSTRLAAHLGLANPLAMRLETDTGIYESRCQREDGRAELRFGSVDAPRALPDSILAAGERRAAFTVVGVPHLIVLVDDVDSINVTHRGRLLRHDPALGPQGANINFVSAGATPSEWRLRTYERGVEGETLACGTGAAAAACVLDHWNLGALPLTIRTRSGRALDVRGQRVAGEAGGKGYDDVWLVGEARLVFRGVII